MNHAHVDTSTNIYSLAHEGDSLEVRFRCSACHGTGKRFPGDCGKCGGAGHTGTYSYQGVTAEIYQRVLAGEREVPGGKPSVGSAFNRLVRGKYRERKDTAA